MSPGLPFLTLCLFLGPLFSRCFCPILESFFFFFGSPFPVFIHFVIFLGWERLGRGRAKCEAFLSFGVGLFRCGCVGVGCFRGVWWGCSRVVWWGVLVEVMWEGVFPVCVGVPLFRWGAPLSGQERLAPFGRAKGRVGGVLPPGVGWL